MASVRFIRQFDFNPAALGGRVTIFYQPGENHNVTRECAAAAIAAGAAENIVEAADDGENQGGGDA